MPLNFHFEPELSPIFAAVRTHLKGEYIGFCFGSSKDRESFSRALDSLQLQLKVGYKRMDALKEQSVKEMENDFQSQIAEAIDAGALFNEKNKERQATELRKLLIVAGLNVEQDLANPEIMSTIMRVL